MGRNTVYSADKAEEILKRLAEGESLNKICQDDHLPPRTTVLQWQTDDREGFSVKYARARETGYLKLADELLGIADASGEDVQRDRLRVDTRKWLLSKMLPKVFGDKVTHQGDQENPIQTAGRIEIVVVDPKG